MDKKDVQEFFKRRMVELFDRNTIDSYRVRAHNAISILQELETVLKGWIDYKVKRSETVLFCIEECISIIMERNEDLLDWSFYSSELFKQEMESFEKSIKQTREKRDIQLTKQLLFYVRQCRECNEGVYLKKLLTAIKKKLFTEEIIDEEQFSPWLQDLDAKLSSFATELIRVGYSKNYLYRLFKKLKDNEKKLSFNSAFEELRNKLESREHKKFIVIFRLSFAKKKTFDINSVAGLCEQLTEEIIQILLKIGFERYKLNNQYSLFYQQEIEELDSGTAARKTYDRLTSILDAHVDDLKKVVVPQSCIIIEYGDEGQPHAYIKNVYQMDDGYVNEGKQEANLADIIDKIQESEKVAQEVKVRILAALRHLRVGDNQSEIEQKFMNYWIALEYIFTSPSIEENTFARMKEYLIDILSSGYIKRNIQVLDAWMIKERCFDSGCSFGRMTDDERAEFIKKAPNILAKYRLSRIKSHLHDKEKTVKYIRQHESHLLQHISRIYRLRNELVHEAAVEQDISQITSNLRFYLVYVMNQMIGYVKERIDNGKVSGIDMFDFFMTYSSSIKLIKAKANIEDILNAPMYTGFVE